MKRILLLLFLYFILFDVQKLYACEHKVFAPSTYYSMADGDLNSNIWSTTAHVGPNCGCDPDGNDDCSIDAGTTVYIKHNVTSNCATLTLGANVNINILNGGTFSLSGNGTLTGTGNVTLESGAVLAIGGDLNLNGGGGVSLNGGTVNVYGDLIANGSGELCGPAGIINVQGSVDAGAVCGTFGGVLPVTFTKFYIKQRDNIEELFWQTASEQNNRVFEIERSIDGIGFEKIGEHKSKAGPTGNSSILLDYLYEDSKPISGYSYYRLKQIDLDNKFKYSKVISVVFEESKNISFVVYPNPSKEEFFVDFKGIENNHEISVNIIDMNGKSIYKTVVYPESLTEGSFKIIPDVALASGKYLVRMQIEGVTHTVKMVVE